MSEKIKAKLEKIQNKAIEKKLKFFKKIINKQAEGVFAEMEGFITNSLTDPIYPKHINKEDIEIMGKTVLFDSLEDCIFDDNITDTNSIGFMVDTKIQGQDITFQCWIMISEDMHIIDSDMQVMSCKEHIDTSFTMGCAVKDSLEAIDNTIKLAD